MTQLYVKPVRDQATGEPRLVRDPITRLPLAADGEFKPRIPYWLRRLAQRDVEEAKPPKPPAADKPKA